MCNFQRVIKISTINRHHLYVEFSDGDRLMIANIEVNEKTRVYKLPVCCPKKKKTTCVSSW